MKTSRWFVLAVVLTPLATTGCSDKEAKSTCGVYMVHRIVSGRDKGDPAYNAAYEACVGNLSKLHKESPAAWQCTQDCVTAAADADKADACPLTCEIKFGSAEAEARKRWEKGIAGELGASKGGAAAPSDTGVALSGTECTDAVLWAGRKKVEAGQLAAKDLAVFTDPLKAECTRDHATAKGIGKFRCMRLGKDWADIERRCMK